MRNKNNIILLFFPLALFFTANIFSEVRTSYYLLGNFDPSYVYLLNSLNISQGIGTGYIEHPGTPLHIIGAAVIRLVFAFDGGSNDIVSDVFRDPEAYLRAINFALIVMNSIALFILGAVVYKLYGSIPVALLLQLTPFYSIVIFDRLSSVTPENLLIFIMIMFQIIALKYINEEELSRKKNFLYLICFSLLTGAGIAAKISFFPLLIIPLILIRKVYNKLLFLLFSSISFIVCVIPAIPYYKFFNRWVRSIIVHNKMYGKGENTFIDSEYFLSNIQYIFEFEKYFAAAFACIVAALFILIVNRKKLKSVDNKKVKYVSSEIKLLTGIFVTMVFQIVIVAKHYALHYMLPAFMLVNTGLFLIVIIFFRLYPDYFGRLTANHVLILLTLLIIALKIPNYVYFYHVLRIERIEPTNITRFLDDNYPDKVVLSGYHTWNKQIGLEFATSWAGSQTIIYRSFLDRMTPHHLYYENFERKIYTLSDTTDALTKSILSSVNEMIFVSNKHNSIENVLSELDEKYNYKGIEYSEVYSNNRGDAVYLIELK